MLRNKKLATIITAVVLAFGASGAAYSYTAPSQYVSFDINPSVELVTNMFDKVIKVNPLNEDGIKIIANLNLNNKDIKEAVDLLTQAAIDNGYLKEELQNEILVTVASNNEENGAKTEEELGQVVKEELKGENLETTPVNTENINLQRKAEAEKLGISPGKMNLIQKLEAVKPGINYEEYAKKPVKDIMKEIKEIRKNGTVAEEGTTTETENDSTKTGEVKDETKEASEAATTENKEVKATKSEKVKEEKVKEEKSKNEKVKKEKSNNRDHEDEDQGNGNHGNGNNGNEQGNEKSKGNKNN
jgi:hypothetical protein